MAFKDTLTPILGDEATAYEPKYETSKEFMNGKFKELLDNDLELLNKINDLKASPDFTGNPTIQGQQIVTDAIETIEFPFATGYTHVGDATGFNSCLIEKTGNKIAIYISLKKIDASQLVVNSTSPIFTLPLGYRPKKNIRLVTGGYPYGTTSVMIITASDGGAYIRSISGSMTELYAQISY